MFQNLLFHNNMLNNTMLLSNGCLNLPRTQSLRGIHSLKEPSCGTQLDKVSQPNSNEIPVSTKFELAVYLFANHLTFIKTN